MNHVPRAKWCKTLWCDGLVPFLLGRSGQVLLHWRRLPVKLKCQVQTVKCLNKLSFIPKEPDVLKSHMLVLNKKIKKKTLKVSSLNISQRLLSLCWKLLPRWGAAWSPLDLLSPAAQLSLLPSLRTHSLPPIPAWPLYLIPLPCMYAIKVNFQPQNCLHSLPCKPQTISSSLPHTAHPVGKPRSSNFAA